MRETCEAGPVPHSAPCATFFAWRDDWAEPIWLGDVVNSPGSDAEPRLGADRHTLCFSSERTLPVRFPRSRAQAAADQARLLAWDNGNYNLWSGSLAPWPNAHRDGKPMPGAAAGK